MRGRHDRRQRPRGRAATSSRCSFVRTCEAAASESESKPVSQAVSVPVSVSVSVFKSVFTFVSVSVLR